jgi:hypothetical protein
MTTNLFFIASTCMNNHVLKGFFPGVISRGSWGFSRGIPGVHYTSFHVEEIFVFFAFFTGCIKKKVIELQRATVSELLCV